VINADAPRSTASQDAGKVQVSTTLQVAGVLDNGLEVVTAEFASFKPEIFSNSMRGLSPDVIVISELEFSRATLVGTFLSSHCAIVHNEALSRRAETVGILSGEKEAFEAYVDLKDLARSQGTVPTQCAGCSTLLDEAKCKCELCHRFVCVPWSDTYCCITLRQQVIVSEKGGIHWSMVEDIPASVVYASIGVYCTSAESCPKPADMSHHFIMDQKYLARLALLSGPFSVLADLHPLSTADPFTDSAQEEENNGWQLDRHDDIAPKPPSEPVIERYIQGMLVSGSYVSNLEIMCASIARGYPIVVHFK